VPELPEVESVRRHLAGAVEGQRIVAAAVSHPRISRRNTGPAEVAERLEGRRVEKIDRWGKFLLGRLDRPLIWVIHLGMSGRVTIADPGEELAPHTHFRALTDRGREVRFIDPRTFGFVAVVPEAQLQEMTTLGRDAFEDLPTSRELSGMLARRGAPIKAVLLDQKVLAGIGNIYADEILHRAGVRPTRPARAISPEEVRRLRAAIRPVLAAGIAAGGTSLADLAYLLPDGRAGDYLRQLRVYGRAGEACRRCGSPIEKTIIAGRSSFYCRVCQQ
jgi:formamidopyrimidine-DNA glycosylase